MTEQQIKEGLKLLENNAVTIREIVGSVLSLHIIKNIPLEDAESIVFLAIKQEVEEAVKDGSLDKMKAFNKFLDTLFEN